MRGASRKAPLSRYNDNDMLADFWWFAGMFLLMHCGGVGSYPGKSGLQCYWEVLYFLLLVGKFTGGCQVTFAGNGLHLLP